MSCYTSPITGQPSVLASLLEQKYGADIRDQIMSVIYSTEFESKYPDTEIPVDEIGKEPTLEWIEKNILNHKSILYQNQTTSTEGQVVSEKTIRDLAARMSDRIGIPVKFESDRSKEYKGKLDKGTVDEYGYNHEQTVAVINLAYATLDTPIHEILGHPIIRAIKNQSIGNKIEEVSKELQEQGYPKYSVTFTDNYDSQSTEFFKSKEEAEVFIKKTNTSLNNLYQNLLKELEYGKGKEVLDRVKRDYNKKFERGKSFTFEGKNYIADTASKTGYRDKYGDDVDSNELETALFAYELKHKDEIYYTLEEQQEEAIVELLGLMTAEKLDAVKDGKLISLLKRLLKEMKQFVRSLLNQKEVEIDKLPDNMTLGDLSDLLAYSNSKLILPGYEVEYTTPDNEKFKTYQEASNHITELAKNVEDVDLDNFTPKNKWRVTGLKWSYDEDGAIVQDGYVNEEFNTKEEAEEFYNNTNNKKYFGELTIEKANSLPQSFIEKNKEYEQSKEIIEEWKKVNNIQYNPEEIYSRGQEFSSVVGAYSDFDVNLMMQNLLSHIEDNEKAGGKFAISAYTKPVDKQIGHLEGGGGKIKFKLYPQSNDILWAANTDVYSGSVWDASEKVSKDKKSELLGVSYTKYPALRNVNSVQPNLASIVDNLEHHHNELGIVLTGNNFRLEYDEDIPYTTKKIIDGINKILDQKYGKLVKPEINVKNREGFKVYFTDAYGNSAFSNSNFNTREEAQAFIDEKKDTDISFKIVPNKGIQPTQTNETLKESIDSVKEKLNENNLQDEDMPFTPKEQRKEYTSQALINTKIAALKEVAKKYPRSLIRSEVVRTQERWQGEFSGFEEGELPFQKISPQQKQQALQLYSQYLESLNKPNTNPILQGNQTNIEEIITHLEKDKLLEIDCKGKLKAEKGLATSFTKGGKWKVIKDLKGYPTHKEGGVDLTIGKDGVSIKNGNTQFTAKHGLVIPKN